MTTKKRYPSDKQDQYIVRFPDGMRDRIRDEAAKNNRSMNAEIIARLEASFTDSPRQHHKLTEEEKEDLWQWMLKRRDQDG